MGDSHNLRNQLRHGTNLPDYLSYENMESGILDKIDKKKKKRRWFFILWIGAGLMAVIGLIYLVCHDNTTYMTFNEGESLRFESKTKENSPHKLTSTTTTCLDTLESVLYEQQSSREEFSVKSNENHISTRSHKSNKDLRSYRSGYLPEANLDKGLIYSTQEYKALKIYSSQPHMDNVFTGDIHQEKNEILEMNPLPRIVTNPVSGYTKKEPWVNIPIGSKASPTKLNNYYPGSTTMAVNAIVPNGLLNDRVVFSGTNDDMTYEIRPYYGWSCQIGYVKPLSRKHRFSVGIRGINTFSIFRSHSTTCMVDTFENKVILKEVSLITGKESLTRGSIIGNISQTRNVQQVNKSLFIQVPFSWQFTQAMGRFDARIGLGAAINVYSRSYGKTWKDGNVVTYTGVHPLHDPNFAWQAEGLIGLDCRVNEKWTIGLSAEYFRSLKSFELAQDLVSRPVYFLVGVSVERGF